MEAPENKASLAENETYQFTWPGKAAAARQAEVPASKSFIFEKKPDDAICYDSSSSKQQTSLLLNHNLYIEGDNIDALKRLGPTHENSIKMIYIDPPYNTGNAFIYEDNFGTSHTEWLNMIYPRLRLARQLLSSDGAIFISIDEGEIHHLKIICNEIFGEENYINTFMWLHGKGKKDSWSRTLQQYIITYAKDKTKLAPWTEKKRCNYKFSNPDKDPKGPWFSGSLSFSEKRSNPKSTNYYTVTSPGGVTWTRQWLIPQTKMTQLISQGNVYFGTTPDYSNVPRIKIRPSDKISVIPNNIIEDCNTTRGAEQYLASLFGKNCFSYPKPYELIQKLASFMNLNNSTVLDFFSGSATTAEAIIRNNIENGTNTKYIMVQQPENLDQALDSASVISKPVIKNAITYLDSQKLPHNICEIGKERIRLAVKKLRKENPDQTEKLDMEFQDIKLSDTNS